MAELKRILSSPVEIYALGGLGEVGKNLYCIENDSSLLIIDCGFLMRACPVSIMSSRTSLT